MIIEKTPKPNPQPGVSRLQGPISGRLPPENPSHLLPSGLGNHKNEISFLRPAGMTATGPTIPRQEDGRARELLRSRGGLASASGRMQRCWEPARVQLGPHKRTRGSGCVLAGAGAGLSQAARARLPPLLPDLPCRLPSHRLPRRSPRCGLHHLRRAAWLAPPPVCP